MSGETHNTVFLRGRKVIIRPMHKATDMAFCQKWINEPDVRYFLLTREPVTLAAEER